MNRDQYAIKAEMRQHGNDGAAQGSVAPNGNSQEHSHHAGIIAKILQKSETYFELNTEIE